MRKRAPKQTSASSSVGLFSRRSPSMLSGLGKNVGVERVEIDPIRLCHPGSDSGLPSPCRRRRHEQLRDRHGAGSQLYEGSDEPLAWLKAINP